MTTSLVYVEREVQVVRGVERLVKNIKYKKIGDRVEMTGGQCVAWRGELDGWKLVTQVVIFHGKRLEFKDKIPIVKEATKTYPCDSVSIPEWD